MATPFRTSLYRTAGWAVISLAVLLTAVPLTRAQFGRRANQSKGPRALGLMEILPNGKARLRPICIMVDGHFYDAGIYKADPVPFALNTGVVYEAERAGVSQGLFTVNDVLQNANTKSFVGEGTWVPAGEEPAKPASAKAETKPRQDEEDKPPVLRRPGTEPQKPAAEENKPQTSSDSKSADHTQPPAAPQDDDSDRPRLHKPQSAQSSSTTQAAQPVTPADNAASDTGSDENDPNRPHLRRGTSKGPMSQPASSSKAPVPTAAASSPKSASTPVPAKAPAKNEIQIMPAISDADGPEPRPYAYQMNSKEEEGFKTKVLALAARELLSKAKELEPGLATAGTPGARTKGSSRPSATEPVWEDVNLRVFDVATNNEPILVLTAKAQLHEPKAARTSAPETHATEFYVTVVAHSDLYGQLRSLFTAVTDDRTLDVTPKYQLIDVVDADGDGRGEMLFRRTSDQGSSYVVYRVGADRLWPLYEGSPSG